MSKSKWTITVEAPLSGWGIPAYWNVLLSRRGYDDEIYRSYKTERAARAEAKRLQAEFPGATVREVQP